MQPSRGGVIPQRGRQGRGVFRSRTALAMAGNLMDAQMIALALEHEEVLLHNTTAEVEEILNSFRDDAGLPSHLIDVPVVAFEEACGGLERLKTDALKRDRKSVV